MCHYLVLYSAPIASELQPSTSEDYCPFSKDVIMRPSMMSLKLLHVNTTADLLLTHSTCMLCCRRFLRETLKMSNAEDLNRLTACSLVLLGHIFYVLGNHRVRRNNNKMLNNIQNSVPEKYLGNEVLNQTKLEFASKNIHLPLIPSVIAIGDCRGSE